MARGAQCGNSWRDGSDQSGTHSAGEGAGRALRNSAAADGQRPCRVGSQGQSPSGVDGVLVEVSTSYRQTEVGVLPDDWKPKALAQLSAFITKGSTPTTY